MIRLLAALLVTLSTAVQAEPRIHRFSVGALEAVALQDGAFDFPNDGSLFADQDGATRLLTAAGVPSDRIKLSIQPLLVRSGKRLVLIDVGNGGTQGQLPAALRLAGVAPADITDVVISHPHPDHVGGLVAGGAPAFPNARVRIAPAAWAAMQAGEGTRALAATIAARVAPLEPGSEVAPGVRTVAIPGHTPGHVGVEIASRGRSLLYVADTVHHYILSLDPDYVLGFDADAAAGAASRRALLEDAARRKRRLYAVHFPFPGLGTVTAQERGFVWVPETAGTR